MHLLHADHIQRQMFPEHHNCIHNELREESLLVRHELAVSPMATKTCLRVERGRGALLQKLSQLLWVIFIECNSDFLEFLDRRGARKAKASNDDLRVDTLLHERLALPQKLPSEKNYAGGAVSDLTDSEKEE